MEELLTDQQRGFPYKKQEAYLSWSLWVSTATYIMLPALLRSISSGASSSSSAFPAGAHRIVNPATNFLASGGRLLSQSQPGIGHGPTHISPVTASRGTTAAGIIQAFSRTFVSASRPLFAGKFVKKRQQIAIRKYHYLLVFRKAKAAACIPRYGVCF